MGVFPPPDMAGLLTVPYRCSTLCCMQCCLLPGIPKCMRCWCRLRGWFQARNPGLTAAEVLTSPFFKPCYEQNWAEGVRNGPSQLKEIGEAEEWVI